MDSIHAARFRAMRRESILRGESLHGIQGFEDRGQSILYNANVVVKNMRAREEEKSSAVKNDKKIARYDEVISDCTRTMKDNLVKLGADENCVAEAVKYVEANQMDQLRYIVLQLLAKRNPGMYARKCAIFGKSIGQRG